MRGYAPFLLVILLTSCTSIKRIFSKKDQLQNPKKIHSSKKINQTPGPTRGLGAEDFKDLTVEYGLKDLKAVHLYGVDLNKDGRQDLVLLKDYFSPPEIYLYGKKSKKFYRYKSNIFDQNLIVSYLVFADFDNDGISDVIGVIADPRKGIGKSELKYFKGSYKNGMMSFVETKDMFKGLNNPVVSLGLLDYNLDGKLDLYLANWSNRGATFHDHLLEAHKKRFRDATRVLIGEQERDYTGALLNAGPSYGVSSCDIDQNGITDILVTSTHGIRNRLWMGRFDAKKSEVRYRDYGRESLFGADFNGQHSPSGGGHSLFSTCADYNQDSIMDIYLGELSHAYDDESKDRSTILTGAKRNNYPPRFLRTEYTTDTGESTWNQSDKRAIWFDYDNDGLIDLLIENSGFPPSSRLILLRQLPDHSFDEVSPKAGIDIMNPSGILVMDINDDGKLDIISGQTNIRHKGIKDRLYVFENQTPWKENRVIRFNLRPRKSNRSAIGAMVSLKTNLRERKIWVDGPQGAYPSHSRPIVQFALTQNEKLDYARVEWPIRKNKSTMQRLSKRYDLKKWKRQRFLKVDLYE